MAAEGLHRYVVGVGSNLGAREAYVAAARDALAGAGFAVEAESPLHETAPVGAADRPFLNGAWRIASPLAPPEALAALLAIEARLGRVRAERWGNRTIDLDLLLWVPPDARDEATAVHGDGDPILPHPRLLERAFALVPAAEVAPDWRLPGGETVAAAAARLGPRL